jgi:hypothetical protein
VKTQASAVAVPARVPRLSELSAPRQALVRLCQSIDYGQIVALQIHDGEPVFSPAPTIVLDVKLDAAPQDRSESALEDFALRDEVCRLLIQIDLMKEGRADRIEVRAGIPRRIVIERRIAEAPL